MMLFSNAVKDHTDPPRQMSVVFSVVALLIAALLILIIVLLVLVLLIPGLLILVIVLLILIFVLILHCNTPRHMADNLSGHDTDNIDSGTDRRKRSITVNCIFYSAEHISALYLAFNFGFGFEHQNEIDKTQKRANYPPHA